MRFYLVTNLARCFQFFRVSALERGRVGKAPVQPFRNAGENGATLRRSAIAYRYHIAKELPRFNHIEDGARLMPRNIKADFGHRFGDNGIELPRFKSRALRFVFVTAKLINERLGHHRARGIVNADKENFSLFHGIFPIRLAATGRAAATGIRRCHFKSNGAGFWRGGDAQFRREASRVFRGELQRHELV